MSEPSRLLADFEALRIAPQDFHHLDHVRVAYDGVAGDMLDAYDFLEATLRYARTIRAMAESAGAPGGRTPEKLNVTITFEFMSVIAEHKADFGGDRETSLRAHPALCEKDLLAHWYRDDRLRSERARRQFLLPEAVSSAAIDRAPGS